VHNLTELIGPGRELRNLETYRVMSVRIRRLTAGLFVSTNQITNKMRPSNVNKVSKYLLPPKSIPAPPALGNAFCWVISGLAYSGNGYLLSERVYGCRVFEANPAHLEVGLEGSSKGLQKTVMLLVTFWASGATQT
jgi:hypothetical protein